VAGLLVDHAVGTQEMSGNKARGDAATARAGDEDVRVVLAHAALEAKSLDCGGAAVGRVLIERHVLVDLHHQRMEDSEDGAARRPGSTSLLDRLNPLL
jgi:hypothetical protein